MKIAPSMLACDFSNMAGELEKIQNADMVHMDVMDGHFVPNISFGSSVIKSLRQYSKLPFDIHLMITNPYDYIGEFVNCGADIITFHVESKSNIDDTIKKIHKLGVKAGLAIKPNTNIKEIDKFIDKIDLALVMTVEPGFGGQKFMYSQMSKVKYLKDEIAKNNLDLKVEIDGGINLHTINFAFDFGVDICVAGTSIFKAENPSKCIEKLKRIKN